VLAALRSHWFCIYVLILFDYKNFLLFILQKFVFLRLEKRLFSLRIPFCVSLAQSSFQSKVIFNEKPLLKKVFFEATLFKSRGEQ